MYNVFKVEKINGEYVSTLMGSPTTKEIAIKRVARFGGYATEVGTKRLLAQTITPHGPHYLKRSIASGEDVCLN